MSQVDEQAIIPESPREEKVNFMDDIDYHRVADHFEVDYETRRDENLAKNLSFIFDWAKTQTKSDDRVLNLEVLRGLTKNLGINYKGKELVKKLYQWTRLDQQRQRIEKEMGLMTDDKTHGEHPAST